MPRPEDVSERRVQDTKMPRRYWLMKCEPEAYTIADLERDGRTPWEGVRNYQARNFMRDQMQEGDGVLFYASNADPSGVTGLAEIARAGYPDPTAVLKGHKYYDPDSRADNRAMRRYSAGCGSLSWKTISRCASWC